MKYNLKNRPNCKIKHLVRAKLVEQWFKGFEQEIREELKHNQRYDQQLLISRGVLSRILKELLGEVS